ncbi:MAG: tetratricopeptide repeat protein [Muribaculaceae bacterium]|nr:tetratricopeptide repeat protein [Muribaculaceae bacterium]
MELRIYTFFIIFTLNCIPAAASTKNSATPAPVRTFLNNLERLQLLSDDQSDEASRLNYENRDCFAGGTAEGNGVKIHNSELYFLNISISYGASQYCNNLFTLLYRNRDLKLSHDIVSTEPIVFADANGKDEIRFYDTKVKKTCIYNGEEKVFWQKFGVDAEDELIDTLEGYDSKPSNWEGNISDKSNKKTNIERGGSQQSEQGNKLYTPPIQETLPQTEKELLRLAARYYTSKDYSSATKTLHQLTAKYPNNAEAWYRLATIIRFKNKWSKNVYAKPKETAIEYMRKAVNLATGSLKTKAERALFDWEHPYSM